MLENIKVSPSPHVSKAHSTRSVMADVIIGLLPATATGIWYFRQQAGIVIAACIIACLVSEFACNKIMKRPNSLGDLSAVVTALILALSLPPMTPIWAAVVGSAVAIVIGKMVFGGLGSNIFNPAMVSRAFMTASFGAIMTMWTIPVTIGEVQTEQGPAVMAKVSASNTFDGNEEIQAITQATPLSWSKQAIKGTADVKVASSQLKASLLGNTGGCLGETSALALLLGGVYLIIRKTITWHIPVATLLAAAVFAAIGWIANPESYVSPLLHLTSGGMLICAFFIATDPVTAPLTKKGMIIFGIALGLIIMLIRMVGEYPEGVMYAILLMNAVRPLIDRMCKLVPAGGKNND